MVRYVIKKTFTFIISLFFIITFTFILMKSIPGDPFIQEDIPKETLDSLYKHYGLDKPLYVQYFKYLKGIVKCDLGPSYIYHGRYVNDIIKDGFIISSTLGIQALILAIFVGVSAGCLAALKKNKWQDSITMFLIILAVSVPNFLLASLLQFFFSIKLKILPVARWGSFSHTILPTIALAAMPAAFIARLMRSNMLEVLEQDYIKTAAAKGLSPWRVIFRHGLRNAIIPVISYLGAVSTYILTGSFVIEKIFGIPGLGQWLIISIYNRDYTVILGLTIFISCILITIVLLSDLAIACLDPRIKISTKKLT